VNNENACSIRLGQGQVLDRQDPAVGAAKVIHIVRSRKKICDEVQGRRKWQNTGLPINKSEDKSSPVTA
jgi:hypothetical protein